MASPPIGPADPKLPKAPVAGPPPGAPPVPPVPPSAVPAGMKPLPGQVADVGIPVEQVPQDQALPLGFFQQPWVQDVLPFVTSLMLHAILVIIGILSYKAYQIIKAPPVQEQIIIPDSSMVENQPPGGIPNVGLGADPDKEAQQDRTPESSNGAFSKKGPDHSVEAVGGSTGDASDAVYAAGAGGGMKGSLSGVGSGNGDDSGALAKYGPPGGGGIGPHGPVFGFGGNARTIVFVCDCTGSMINKISELKLQLSRQIQDLKPIQSFDIIFYQDEKVLKLSDGMITASPDNKRKAAAWLDDIVTAGTTDPVPALTYGLTLKPQLMYFLTDAADFPDVDAVKNVFRKVNADHKTKVNPILFVENAAEKEANKESEPLMKGIADENGGIFTWRIIDDLH